MTEALLHFIWQHRPFSLNGLRTAQGEEVEVIDPGLPNPHAGPDFFNAKVRLGGALWAGNVEMHVKASDWFAHGHHTDPRYNNVVLHVVVHADRPALCAHGAEIPTLAIPYPSAMEARLNKLMDSEGRIPCHRHMQELDPFRQLAMLQRLMVERLQQKSEQVLATVVRCKGSWEEAYYRAVVRCFGLKANALPAELLAQSLPLTILGKHKNSPFQIEALLFGQSGLLHGPTPHPAGSYPARLLSEHTFLAQKYGLTPIDGALWRFLRMRPSSFPTLRIAQLAALISQSTGLFSRSMEAPDLESLEHLYTATPSDFWHRHYTLGGKESPRSTPKPIGRGLAHTIILNATVPFLFAHGRSRAINGPCDKALHILETMPPEANSVVDGFKKLGLTISSAADSQAAIHLKASRCDAKKCLHCEVGTAYLNDTPNDTQTPHTQQNT
ncbi:MAG: DUF2851 family protein [Bacteroidales bacterium]|nr:DUF2851 family protein [Bacteroidales bacterium]